MSNLEQAPAADPRVFLFGLDGSPEQLFGVQPGPDEAAISITGLCRATRRGGGRTPALASHLETIPGTVEAVLAGHPEQLASTKTSPEEGVIISGIVSAVFTQWEISRAKHGEPMLLGVTEEQTSALVTETVRAASEIIGTVRAYDVKKNKTDAANVAKLLACWGPEFVKGWFDGTILERWADSHDMSAEERQDWQSLATPSFLKTLSIKKAPDPVSALESAKHQLDTAYSDASIAAVFEVSPEETANVLSRRDRLYLAVHHPRNPEETLRTYKEHTDIISFYRDFSKICDLSIQETKFLLPVSMRAYFARLYPENPHEAARQWLRGRISVSDKKDMVRDKKLAELKVDLTYGEDQAA